MKRFALALVLFSFVACVTGGDGIPFEDESGYAYAQPFERMWIECGQVMKKTCRGIESLDRDAKTMVSKWDTQLAAFSEQGYRLRLTVELVDKPEEGGWIVKVKEEREVNSDAVNPSVLEEAEWEGADADGSVARRFLFELHRRLQPRETWRDEAERADAEAERARSMGGRVGPVEVDGQR